MRFLAGAFSLHSLSRVFSMRFFAEVFPCALLIGSLVRSSAGIFVGNFSLRFLPCAFSQNVLFCAFSEGSFVHFFAWTSSVSSFAETNSVRSFARAYTVGSFAGVFSMRSFTGSLPHNFSPEWFSCVLSLGFFRYVFSRGRGGGFVVSLTRSFSERSFAGDVSVRDFSGLFWGALLLGVFHAPFRLRNFLVVVLVVFSLYSFAGASSFRDFTESVFVRSFAEAFTVRSSAGAFPVLFFAGVFSSDLFARASSVRFFARTFSVRFCSGAFSMQIHAERLFRGARFRGVSFCALLRKVFFRLLFCGDFFRAVFW